MTLTIAVIRLHNKWSVNAILYTFFIKIQCHCKYFKPSVYTHKNINSYIRHLPKRQKRFMTLGVVFSAADYVTIARLISAENDRSTITQRKIICNWPKMLASETNDLLNALLFKIITNSQPIPTSNSSGSIYTCGSTLRMDLLCVQIHLLRIDLLFAKQNVNICLLSSTVSYTDLGLASLALRKPTTFYKFVQKYHFAMYYNIQY